MVRRMKGVLAKQRVFVRLKDELNDQCVGRGGIPLEIETRLQTLGGGESLFQE